jgi:MHS family proline/betaine transporter-like MFS transporter
MLAGIYPAFAWLSAEPSLFRLLFIQGLLGLATAAYLGAVPALMAELFPARMRGRGLSVSYALGVAIFGGFAPFIHEWLIVNTGQAIAPSYYLMMAACIGLLALFGARRLGHP